MRIKKKEREINTSPLHACIKRLTEIKKRKEIKLSGTAPMHRFAEIIKQKTKISTTVHLNQLYSIKEMFSSCFLSIYSVCV